MKQKEIQAKERKEQKQGMIPTAKYTIIADGSDKDEARFSITVYNIQV